MNDEHKYSPEEIRAMTRIEGIRWRPGMYLRGGLRVDGFYQLLLEVVQNAVAEYDAGFADTVKVIIHKDESVSIVDNGRGIPFNLGDKKSNVETLFTEFQGLPNGNLITYFKNHRWLHSAGSAIVVNAVSEFLQIEVAKDKNLYRIAFEKGVTKEPFALIGENPNERNGTKVRFKPDLEIFKDVNPYWDYSRVCSSLREVTFLFCGLKIILIDERTEQTQTETLYEINGMGAYAKSLVTETDALYEKPILLEDILDQGFVRVGFFHSSTQNFDFVAYTNMRQNINGGTHVTGFQMAYVQVMNQYAKSQNFLEQDMISTSENWLVGLRVAISLQMDYPYYDMSTLNKLLNPEAQVAVEKLITEKLPLWLEENPHIGKIIVERAVKAAQARVAFQTVKTPSDLQV
jgi:DNA gyrase subunit B